MKNWFKFFAITLISVFAFTACGDDEDDHGDNEITINIISPSPDEVIDNASSVTINVEINASDENHEIEIIMHPDGDANDKILDVDIHDHDRLITFQQTVDLSSYPNGQEFHLEVLACKDHNCEDREIADVDFSIQ